MPSVNQPLSLMRILAVVLMAAAVFFLASELIGDDSVSATGGAAQKGSLATTGADLIRDKCQRCHTLKRIQTSRRSSREWRVIVAKMESYGVTLTQSEHKTLNEYLSTEF